MRSITSELALVLKLFGHDAARQRKRLALTVAAVAWGTLSIVMLLSFGEGLKRSITKGARGLGDGIGILWPGATTRVWQGLPSGRAIGLREDDRELLKARIPELAAISAEYAKYDSVAVGKKRLNVRVRGVDPCFGELRNLVPRAGGRFLNERDVAEKRRVVFLGEELAQDLFGSEDVALGRTVEIRQTPFLVIGVAQHKLQMGMYEGPDSKQATLPSSTFKSMFNATHPENFVYRAASRELGDQVRSEIYRVLGGVRRFDPDDEHALGLWDTRKMQRINGQMSLGIQMFLGVIGALTLLVGGMGVANVMFAVVKERTREIGVKMALGAKARQIMLPFVFEGLLITLLGGLVGTLLSLGLILVLAALPLKGPAFEILGRPTFSPGVALATAVTLGTIGMLAGLFPARRAALVEPAVSLRYE
jgi:putative ABC transport system permease protein